MFISPKKIYFALICTFTIFFCSCDLNKVSVKIDSDWKYKNGDDRSWSKMDFDDSSWNNQAKLNTLELDKSHYVWVRKTVEVPSSLKNQNIWLGFQKSNCAAEVYADGVFIGLRGKMPPNPNIRTEKSQDILIPSNLLEDGKVVLAIRIYGAGNLVNNLNFCLDNDDAAYFQNTIKGVFNQRCFLVLAFLCLFIMIYSLASFIADPKQYSLLYFSICIFFIIFYFYDLGSENLLVPFNMHRAMTRSFLSISMSFLALFLNSFFKRKWRRQLQIGVLIFDIFDIILFMANAGNDKKIDSLFTMMLAAVFGVVIYGFVVVSKGLKEKDIGSLPLIIGFSSGSILAVHDVICQVVGIVPFMWLQGFSFFFIDIAVFITLTIKSAKTQRSVVMLAEESNQQRNRLSGIFENAKAMATESASISKALNESVEAVAAAASLSKTKVNDINNAIMIQQKVQQNTQEAMEYLTQFLDSLNNEFESEVSMIADTAEGTKNVILGITTVGEGVNSAAEFTSSLSSLTTTGSHDMKMLMDVMSQIQDSSKEILGVVTTLDDFAQQTDLLAMNASIEAAHSGEAGKGFAVIAHEIKDLAAKTSQWSAKIGEIITSIIEQIQKSVVLSQKVNTALNQIEEGAVVSATKVNTAADGMRSQQESGNNISLAAQNLAESASKMKDEVLSNSQYADKVVGYMQELSDASKNVDDASSGISKESESLSDQVGTLTSLAQRTTEAAQALLDLMNQ